MITMGRFGLIISHGRSIVFSSETDGDSASSEGNGPGLKCERSVKDERSVADTAPRDLVAIFGNCGILAGPWLNCVSFCLVFFLPCPFCAISSLSFVVRDFRLSRSVI